VGLSPVGSNGDGLQARANFQMDGLAPIFKWTGSRQFSNGRARADFQMDGLAPIFKWTGARQNSNGRAPAKI